MEMGDTRVICTASITRGAPQWRMGSGLGWVTAEYGMLPASTGRRKRRPIDKPDSRGVEIQRLIGRVVRNVVRMDRLGENTVHLDCDVLQADGGTRTASVTGAYVALALAVKQAEQEELFVRGALRGPVAAVSVGIGDSGPILDLDYREDSTAEVDMNVAMLPGGKFVELQGTAEGRAFNREELDAMLDLATKGIRKLMTIQRKTIRGALP
jgi:ribonuclease PH